MAVFAPRSINANPRAASPQLLTFMITLHSYAARARMGDADSNSGNCKPLEHLTGVIVSFWTRWTLRPEQPLDASRSCVGRASRVRHGLVLPLLILAGCSSGGLHPLRPLEIPTAPYQGVVTTSLTGTLLYEGGCLLFRDDRKRVQLIPIWPDGTTFNGTSVIFHEPGKADQRIVLTEEFLMEGQPVSW